MAAAHTHKTSSWVVVVLIVLSSIVLGVAFVAQSLALAIIGGVIGLLGLVGGAMFRIMDDAH